MSRTMSLIVAAFLAGGGLALAATDADAHKRHRSVKVSTHGTKVAVHKRSVVVHAPGGVFVDVNWGEFVSVTVNRHKKRVYRY